MAKDIRKTIRFSEKEFQQIQQQLDLAEISFAEFARLALLKKKIKLPIERERIYQLNKIGNNLNQIARGINTLKGTQKLAMLQKLVDLEKEIKALK